MQQKRSGYVWLISAGALFLYGVVGLTGFGLPGIEELVKLLARASGWEFVVAGFVAIFLEGLYVIGNFFPGSTTVMLLAILSSFGSWWQFLGTIFAIFVGWSLAGLVNIAVAYRSFQAGKPLPEHVFIVRDNFWLSWFPAFRANYEVSQIASGGHLWDVVVSAIRVRFFASAALAGILAVISSLLDLNAISNQESFVSVLLIATIMAAVGYYELRHAKQYKS